jgi:hypothetical protein
MFMTLFLSFAAANPAPARIKKAEAQDREILRQLGHLPQGEDS